MKKLSFILSILVLLVYTFVSCGDNHSKNSVSKDSYVIDNNTIRYPIDLGTKIELLSPAEQHLIDEYVSDCQNIMASEYAYRYLSKDYQYYSNPYFSFTNVFVYDFRNVDEDTMSEFSLKMWNYIKENIGHGKQPLMYIELDGYARAFFDNYAITSFEETGKINGFFIFTDNSVVQLNYQTISQVFYKYQLIDGTEIINCGDKYANKLSTEDILTFDFNQQLIRLKIME